MDAFLEFIVSPIVMMDLPFGSTTITWESGERESIPNVLRLMVNERICDQYHELLKQSGQNGLWMSQSSHLRILHYCKATTQKSLYGLDYYTYSGVEVFQP